MKRFIVLLLALCALLPASACASGQGDDQAVGGGLQSAVIRFDFSNGSAQENIKEETHHSYETISAADLVDALSSMSGLDFAVTLSSTDGRFVADWAADSTLIAGLDDRPQREGFEFYDADALRWFMMDSLKKTLGKEEIYYTMDGGRELAFDELYPVNVFPSDLPYMGSAFYFAHADEASEA